MRQLAQVGLLLLALGCSSTSFTDASGGTGGASGASSSGGGAGAAGADAAAVAVIICGVAAECAELCGELEPLCSGGGFCECKTEPGACKPGSVGDPCPGGLTCLLNGYVCAPAAGTEPGAECVNSALPCAPGQVCVGGGYGCRTPCELASPPAGCVCTKPTTALEGWGFCDG